MLDKKEIKEIEDEIRKGKSDYRIGKERHRSPNTIGRIRAEMLETEPRQTQENDVPYHSPIEKIRGIISDLTVLIQTEALNDRERKQLERLLEKLKEIIRVEVDERISSERADTVEKRDQEWKKYVEQNYVKKEVATSLEITIQAKDATINDFRKIIREQDEAHLKDQTDICNFSSHVQNMQNQIQDLSSWNKVLNDKNYELYNYIENRLDDDVRRDQEQLRHDREMFGAEKTRFAVYDVGQQSNLNALFFEGGERIKAVEMREKLLDKQEEEQQKQEKKFNEYKNRCDKEISEIITGIKTHVDEIAEVYCEKLVKRSFDKQINEIAVEWKKINDQKEQITKQQEVLKKTIEEQKTDGNRLQKLQILLEKTQEKQKCAIVHPGSCSGVPVVQSGFSPG